MGLKDCPTDSSTTSKAMLVPGANDKSKFKITRSGIEYSGPAYSMPKDTEQSFLRFYERKGKATPGP